MGEEHTIREGVLSTLALDVHDLRAVISAVGIDRFMDELIGRLGHAIRTFDPAETEHKLRTGFSYEQPELGLVEWMPTMQVGDVVSVKTVGYHPDNPTERMLPSVLATTSLYDTRTGRLEAICEATLLTALRTGAASAVVTSAVAKPGPVVLGVVGAGAQAVTQIHAISRVRPVIRIIATDENADVARSLQARLPNGLCPVEVVDHDEFRRLVPELDVLCTCTSVARGQGPVVDLTGANPWLHVNAVGADFPGKTELRVDQLRDAIVIADVVEQSLVEGESQVLDPDELGPDMVDVVSSTSSAHLMRAFTVFDSTGWSYEDLIAARLFIHHAERLGLGTALDLQHAPTDPYNPYELLDLDSDDSVEGPAQAAS